LHRQGGGSSQAAKLNLRHHRERQAFHPILLALLLLGLCIGIAGCATVGTDFARLAPADLVIGKTTYKDVVARLGTPYKETFDTTDGIKYRWVSYMFVSDEAPAHVPGVVARRDQVFMFHNDLLVGDVFFSTFRHEDTDFDQTRISQIERGKTTLAELIALLGQPAGRMVHPVDEQAKDTVMRYQYNQMLRPVLAGRTFEKSLSVVCGPDGVVKDFEYRSTGAQRH
jgi:hypothetical protein